MPVMAGAVSAIRSRATAVASGGGGGGGAVPADVSAGVAAWRMVGWGAGDWIYGDQSYHTGYHNQGWGGCAYVNGYPYGLSGGANDFQATTATGLGSQFALQKQLEGLAEAAAPNAKMGTFEHNTSGVSYVGVHFQSDAATTGGAPFGDWHNTTLRATVAAFMGRMAAAAKLCSLDGIAGDTEPYYGKTWNAALSNGHTVQENRDAAYAWGYAIGQAVFTAFPGCNTMIYSFYPPYGWNMDRLQGAGANTASLQIDFWHGYLAAMKDLDGNGRFIILDATWYRPDPQVSGALLNMALLYNTQGALAWMSRYFASSVWDYASDRIDITPMSWRGTDGSAYYMNSVPSDSTWSGMVSQYRLSGMGGLRAEYNFEGSPDLTTIYNGATLIAGAQAAASTASVDSTVPSLAVTSNSTAGGVKTLAGTASHAKYGIRCINFYNVSNVKVGAAQMTWNTNGGSYTTNYDAARMDWTASVPASATYATVVSAKDQRHSLAV